MLQSRVSKNAAVDPEGSAGQPPDLVSVTVISHLSGTFMNRCHFHIISYLTCHMAYLVPKPLKLTSSQATTFFFFSFSSLSSLISEIGIEHLICPQRFLVVWFSFHRWLTGPLLGCPCLSRVHSSADKCGMFELYERQADEDTFFCLYL